jgi:hypothetical protein
MRCHLRPQLRLRTAKPWFIPAKNTSGQTYKTCYDYPTPPSAGNRSLKIRTNRPGVAQASVDHSGSASAEVNWRHCARHDHCPRCQRRHFLRWPRAKFGNFARLVWDPYSARKTPSFAATPTAYSANFIHETTLAPPAGVERPHRG